MASNLVDDLFAIAPELDCTASDPAVSVTAGTATGDGSFTACTQSAGAGSTSVHLRSGVAYPVHLQSLPRGVTVTSSDVLRSGDTVGILRNLFWMTHGQLVIPGARIGTVTVTPTMTGQVRLQGSMDYQAVAQDICLAFLLTFSGVGKEAEASVDATLSHIAAEAATADGGSQALAESTRKAVTDAADDAGVVNTATTSASKKATPAPDQSGNSGEVTAVTVMENLIGLGDCVLDSREAVHPQGSAKQRLTAGVKAATTCIKTVMGHLEVGETLTALLDSVRIVPELVQAQLAAVSSVLTLGRYHLTSVYADIARFDAAASLRTYVNTDGWYAHWHRLVITPDGTGTLYYRGPAAPPVMPCMRQQPAGCHSEFRLVVTAQGAYLHITSANGPLWAAGQDIPIKHVPGKDQLIAGTDFDNPHAAGNTYLTFCGPAAVGECGA